MAESCRERARNRFPATLFAGLAIAAAWSDRAPAEQLLLSEGSEARALVTRVLARDSFDEAPGILDRTIMYGHEFGAQATFSGPQTTFCVRLCDGFYFPVPDRARANTVGAEKTCTAMCPAAKTAVFNGRVIDHAITVDGTKYNSLQNAFLYRKATVENCTCTPDGGGSMAAGSGVTRGVARGVAPK